MRVRLTWTQGFGRADIPPLEVELKENGWPAIVRDHVRDATGDAAAAICYVGDEVRVILDGWQAAGHARVDPLVTT